MALQSLLLPIVSLFKSQGIASARQAMFGLNKDFAHFASSVGRAAGAFAAFQGLAGARDFALQSVETTQRFERNLLALQQVFEEVTPQIRAFSREIENYGLSQSQAAQASVFLGSVLKQYGFSTQESADQTERLVMLAQDLATTFGYDVQEALLAITALFRGEFDPIEKFGVAMKQSEINARLAADGLGNLEGEAFNLASAQTRLTMLFERANDSVGAYGRATNTLYAAQQQLSAITQNLQVAFGSNLQEPIAAVINQFTAFAKEFGPDVVDIGNELGNVIDDLAPLFGELSRTFFLLIAPLESVVRFLGLVGRVVTAVLTPAFALINHGLDRFNTLLNFAVIQTDLFDASLQKAGVSSDGFVDFLNEVLHLDRVVTFFESLDNSIEDAFDSMQDFVDFTRNNNFTDASRDTAMLEGAIRNTSVQAKEAAAALSFFEGNLRTLGVFSRDVESELSGLALIFNEIDIAARKSNASEALDDIGFSAGQIEQILTRPDWELIFGQISRLAQAAAIDVTRATTLGIVNAALAQKTLDELMKGLFSDTGGGGGGAAAVNYVKDFFTKLDEEVEKQNARRKLTSMGASEGLIESILGSAGFEKIIQKIVSGGISQLRSLQQQFNKTKSGIDEINALQEEATRLFEEAREAADEAAEAIARQQEEYDNLIATLEDFKASISGIALGGVLATNEEEVGRFESSVVASFNRIQSSLRSALDNGLIFEMAFRQLVDFANQEGEALRQLSRQRDELAAKGDWVEGLLRQYRSAFTSALSLTGLLNKLEKQATEVAVTEVTSGVTSIGDSLKQLRFTLTRSYTETIEETTSKSEGLLNSFRDIAIKARMFAENLERLRKLGLDPQLFNQLVQAGVEAGGETAQALIDGGSETITEINSLFKEIGDLGVSVGETVAEDFYSVGETFASALLDGIRSQQAAFEETARQMASAFEENFASKVGRATQQVAETANLNNQLDAFGKEQQRIANRIAEQEAILTGGTAGPGARAWAEKKLGSYLEQLESIESQISGTQGAINQIQVTPLATGGIALGAALAMIGEGGPEAVIPLDRLGDMMSSGKKQGSGNVYNVYVTADTRVGGSKAGEAIVQQLKNFEDRNGPISSVLTVA